jgi:site-specific DNA recombinase
MTAASSTVVAQASLRCAIYTRKSTEEGLDQEFNSLDAQREACEAFIQSQKHLGWAKSTKRYDDGGFTGANMNRPAMERLMADIESGEVDVVVVYKVDRLSRSLLDFARIIEMFEKKKVSFVSVTQQFNTAQSLGRLVLNILLSFAQFEREMIAERTRDKMAAAKRKGKWVGGPHPLGYDVVDRKLVVNEEEAEQVRLMFNLYIQERSLLRVVETLNRRGIRTKVRPSKEGEERGGVLWEKSTLRRLLRNVTYIGKVEYKDEIHPGEQPGIVDPAIFDQVGKLLGESQRVLGPISRNKYGYLLRGLVRCVHCSSVMTASTTAPRGKAYRYYSCTEPHRRGTDACPVRTAPAPELEQFIVQRIKDLGEEPSLLREALQSAADQRTREKPLLEKEQRRLQVKLQNLKNDSRKLVDALAAGHGHEVKSITERLTQVDAEAADAERRLCEVRESLAQLELVEVDPNSASMAMMQFTPLWEALTANERTRLVNLLIERVDYDGVEQTIDVSFRPMGLATFAREATVSGELQ